MQGSPLSVYPQSCGMGKFNKADDDDENYDPSCRGVFQLSVDYLAFCDKLSWIWEQSLCFHKKQTNFQVQLTNSSIFHHSENINTLQVGR